MTATAMSARISQEARDAAYEIARIAGYWRLMRGRKMVATYRTKKEAQLGMLVEKRRDLARIK